MAEQAAAPRAAPLSIVRHPVYAMLLPLPVVCFVGALITDLSYSGSGGNLIWVDFSSWLIAAGLLFGAIAGLVLVVDLVRVERSRRGSVGWAQLLLMLAAWIVELINAFVHARDGWTAVVPIGLTLSILGVVLILVSAWLWQSVRYSAGGDPR